MDENKRQSLLEKFDRFAGGRSLTAIYECEHLSDKEQAVMLYFGHCAEFQKDGFVHLKAHRLETIAKKIRVSPDTARRAIHSLVDRGYVAKVRRLAANGFELTPEYSLTWKIFKEYQENWLLKKAHDEKVNDLGDSNLLAGGSNLQGGGSNLLGRGLQDATPIIDPSYSCPSPAIDPPPLLGGCNGEHPANVDGDVVDAVSRVELLFSNARNGYVPYKRLNKVFAEVRRQHGLEGAVQFAEYLKLIWEENRPKTWLGVGSKRPEEYRLSLNSMDTYLKWWQETATERGLH